MAAALAACGSFSGSGESTTSAADGGANNPDGGASVDGGMQADGGTVNSGLIDGRVGPTGFVQVVTGTSVCTYDAQSAGPYCVAGSNDAHSCALRNDGRVYCWGSNKSGRLGYLPPNPAFEGGPGPVMAPRAVKALDGKAVRALAAGTDHTCAVLQNGAVWCWGYNWNGQLGFASGQQTDKPNDGVAQEPRAANFPKALDAVEVKAGLGHTCARNATGTVLCVGKADNKEQDVFRDPTDFFQISASRKTSCGITKSDGQLACSGDSNAGQIAEGGFLASRKLRKNASAVSVGASHVCAMFDNGPACWGQGSSFGTNGRIDSDPGYPLLAGTGAGGNAITRVEAGGRHTCYIKGGNAYCIGANDSGQAGLPIGASKPEAGNATFNDVLDLSAATNHTCAVNTSGEVFCWGSNLSGQLGGEISETFSGVPVFVKFTD